MSLSLLLVAAVPFAWLLPNHYYPWPSAWQDGFTLVLLAFASLLSRRPATFPAIWCVWVGIALLSILGQWLTGRILFGGDALLAAIYVVAFALAVVIGTASAAPAEPGAMTALEIMATTTVVCAIASVGVAAAQWTGTASMGIYAADLPPGARPFGNVAQANHLCTLVFIGLCALALLYETRRIAEVTFGFGAAFMLFGMVASGSRTGWLQLGGALGLVALLRGRSGLRLRVRDVAAAMLAFAAMSLTWPAVNDALLLSGSRSLAYQAQAGVRLPLWWALLDAVGREPLWGYGWQQVVLAQQAVALDHPPLQRHFEHSHNMLLDLLLWCGVPVGGLLAGLAGWAIVRQILAVRDSRGVCLMVGVGGVLVHAMFEFPLENAYFLVPVGLALGATHALNPAQTTFSVRPLVLRVVGGAFALIVTAVAWEYLQAEMSHRMLRLETAHIGTSRIESSAPELHLLTQLGAFLSFARNEAKPGMVPAEIEEMRRVSQRFAYPSAMFRYALALGLNGNPATAQRTLALLCSMHTPPRCSEAQEGWRTLRQAQPELPAFPPQ